MAEWIEPIFDRTQADVDFAIAKLQEWKTYKVSDIYDLKGCFNVSDINRIENDIRYLSDALSELYYFSHVETKTWDINSIPNQSDIDRIIQNTRTLILSICEDAPELPTTLLTIDDVNCIEFNLHKIKMILDEMTTSTVECGTFDCGEV